MARTLSIEAREKVLTAAQSLLVEVGIEHLTVDAVAQRSGVAKTTIYRHFANAHDLAIEAIGCMIDPVATPNTGSLRADLLELFADRLPLLADPQFRPMVLGLLSAAARDPEFERVHQSLKEQRTEPERTVIELARARGEIRDDIDIEDALALVEGPMFLRVMVLGLPTTEEDLATLIDLSVTALSVRDGRQPGRHQRGKPRARRPGSP